MARMRPVMAKMPPRTRAMVVNMVKGLSETMESAKTEGMLLNIEL